MLARAEKQGTRRARGCRQDSLRGCDVISAVREKEETVDGLPAQGDAVSYRALDGSFWRATVIMARPNGKLDVEVGGSPPLKLTKLTWWTGDPAQCPRRSCTDKAQAENQR